ncbi:MAG: L-ascorbate metabolism protein UlaG (beta-lactamase superfamily) [Chlamydiales bacterium]|jgi:L-ascorbate metabolism protein UlaG (beta-lactamase superfamily)
MATSPQVLGGLDSTLGDDDAAQSVRERLTSLLPDPGETLAFEHNGIEVAFLRIPHAGNRPTIQNLGHLIQFEGLTILHIGDADGSGGVLEPYGLKDVHIDVALLPYWLWSSAAGQELVQTHLAADTLVAIHIPPREVATVAESLSTADGGGVHVFRESLESLRFDGN